MKDPKFEVEFWALFDERCRPAIENACRNHLYRMRNTCVDADDMVSWANGRVWKMIEDRPNELLTESLSRQNEEGETDSHQPLIAALNAKPHMRAL